MRTSAINSGKDLVRKNTSNSVNEKIDRRTTENVLKYSNANSVALDERIQSLNKEWDIERHLQLISATKVLLGICLGLTVNKKWFLLSAVSAGFLVQHSIQGWCPTVTLLRRLGIRTKNEIDIERNALEFSRFA